MAGYVSPVFTHDPAPGLVIPAAWGDAVDAGLDYLATLKARARVYNSAAQSIANSTTVALTFNSERFDIGGCHSISSNTSRLTVPTAQDGSFLIGGGVSFAANASGLRQLLIRLNGSTVIAQSALNNNGAGSGTEFPITTFYQLAAGDYVELCAFQNSGGALNSQVGANYAPEFWMTWMST